MVNSLKVSMMQPAFLPWQGLFELIYNCDIFIFLDDFQFVVQSHHTRNKLFVGHENVDYYNVPVQKSECFEIALNKTLIVKNPHWKKKLLRTLEYNYQKTPFYSEIHPSIKHVLEEDSSTLAELNIKIILEICKILKIEKKFLYSSNFSKETKSTSKRSKRITELIDWAGAGKYLSAFGSFDYMKEDNFDFEKYCVLFQNYIPKPYPQIHSNNFVPYLSVLDALYNIGNKATLELIKKGTEKWLNAKEREQFNETAVR